MSERISVIVPVRDGARYLRELLDAVGREGASEVLVIDSGSRDDSVAIAQAAGARVIEIDPADFGHGRTRNLAAEEATGDVLAFLTQDATPAPGWLAAHVEALELDPRVGVSFGPHLPREDTSPMIARELTQFFALFSANHQLDADLHRTLARITGHDKHKGPWHSDIECITDLCSLFSTLRCRRFI